MNERGRGGGAPASTVPSTTSSCSSSAAAGATSANNKSFLLPKLFPQAVAARFAAVAMSKQAAASMAAPVTIKQEALPVPVPVSVPPSAAGPSRAKKRRRSVSSTSSSASSCDLEERALAEATESCANLSPEERRQRRKIRNRMSAQLHRERQRKHVEELEKQLQEKDTEIEILRGELGSVQEAHQRALQEIRELHEMISSGISGMNEQDLMEELATVDFSEPMNEEEEEEEHHSDLHPTSSSEPETSDSGGLETGESDSDEPEVDLFSDQTWSLIQEQAGDLGMLDIVSGDAIEDLEAAATCPDQSADPRATREMPSRGRLAAPSTGMAGVSLLALVCLTSLFSNSSFTRQDMTVRELTPAASSQSNLSSSFDLIPILERERYAEINGSPSTELWQFSEAEQSPSSWRSACSRFNLSPWRYDVSADLYGKQMWPQQGAGLPEQQQRQQSPQGHSDQEEAGTGLDLVAKELDLYRGGSHLHGASSDGGWPGVHMSDEFKSRRRSQSTRSSTALVPASDKSYLFCPGDGEGSKGMMGPGMVKAAARAAAFRHHGPSNVPPEYFFRSSGDTATAQNRHADDEGSTALVVQQPVVAPPSASSSSPSSASYSGEYALSNVDDQYLMVLVPVASVDWGRMSGGINNFNMTGEPLEEGGWLEIGCQIMNARVVQGVSFNI
jgi:hypothetical protein